MIDKEFNVCICPDEPCEDSLAFAVFADFSFCQIESKRKGSKTWWETSPLKRKEIIFDSEADFEKYISSQGKKLLPTSIVLSNSHCGNYGCGNYERVVKIFVNPSLVLSFPVEELSSEQYGEESWETTEEQKFYITEENKKYVCTCLIESGKGGRGCDSYCERVWDIQEVEDFPNPATQGKKVKL